MKLGSLKEGGRDGTLVVVSRDLSRAVKADGIAPTLQAALDDWSNAAPRLNALSDKLNAGAAAGAFALDVRALASPLPRAYEFVDGSAYLPHVERVRRARGAEVPASFYTDPLMYQPPAPVSSARATRWWCPVRISASTWKPRWWWSPTTCRWQ